MTRAGSRSLVGLAAAGAGASILLGASAVVGGGTAPRADPIATFTPAATWTRAATAIGEVTRTAGTARGAADEVARLLTPRLCRELVAGTAAPDCAAAVLARFAHARRPYPGLVRLRPLGESEAFGCAGGHLIRLTRSGRGWLVDAFGRSAACPPSFA